MTFPWGHHRLFVLTQGLNSFSSWRMKSQQPSNQTKTTQHACVWIKTSNKHDCGSLLAWRYPCCWLDLNRNYLFVFSDLCKWISSFFWWFLSILKSPSAFSLRGELLLLSFTLFTSGLDMYSIVVSQDIPWRISIYKNICHSYCGGERLHL